jgi:signal transduction histidine kinase
MTNKYLSRWLLGKWIAESTRQDIFTLQRDIVPAVTYAKMNDILEHSMKRLFRIQRAEVIVFNEINKKTYQAIHKYFSRGWEDNIYIHDVVFQEERHSQWADIDAIIRELPNHTFLMFPIMDEAECVGIFILGAKNFRDFYTEEEVRILKNFSYFLSSHVRYIKTYKWLQELTNELDKKVDEKTIEHNNLISQQKEFISVISHEVRSPIGSAIFQTDSIMDDVKDGTYTSASLLWELALLLEKLTNTSEIIQKMFSIQYFNSKNVSLFRIRVSMHVWLKDKIDLYKRMYPHIEFRTQYARWLGYLMIDKTQMEQVINNILNNAIKFAHSKDPKILIHTWKDNTYYYLSIEDNGTWFDTEADAKRIFEKFYRWDSPTSGLGMWLYLCKEIITLHWWTIEAREWHSLGGAEILITLPNE